MKTKLFILLCLILCLGALSSSAQNGKPDETKSYSYYSPGWWECPVYCDGVLIDYLAGSGDIHIIDHYQNGLPQFEIMIIQGTGWSTETGEEFTFKEKNMIWIPREGVWTSHDNIRLAGEKGTMYNISLIIDMETWSVEVKNATCTGNAK